MNKRNVIYGIVSLLITILGVAVYVWFASENDFLQRYPVTAGSFNKIQYFKIRPETILVSLENDGAVLFQKIDDSSVEKITESPISWSQAEYGEIAYKIHEFVWTESLDNWNLYRMIFSTSCNDNPTGFDYADYIYFQEIVFNGKKVNTARDIFIAPQYGDITLGSDTNFPRPFSGWKSIDLDRINVTAEEALRIAEGTGGKSFRLSVQNVCQIYVSMNPDGYGHGDWKVVYGGNSEINDLEIIVPASE